MDFSFTEDQEMLRKAARSFLENECPESFVREVEEGEEGYSPEMWKEIADLGWLGLVYPEKYGGNAGSICDLAVLYGEMGRAMFPSPHLSTVVLCGLTILASGNEEQKADLLPKIVKGDLILAMALTEPESSWDGTGWDPQGVIFPATPDGNDYVLNGTKLFVHDARIADKLLVATRTRESAKPEDGITLFLVDARIPGISYTLLKTTAGDKQYEVVFDKVKVRRSDIVGDLHSGWAPLAKSVQIGAVMLCAEMVGAGWRILDLTVDYAKTRVQFEQPIGVNQYIQEYCVDLLACVESAENITYQAAWRLSGNLPSDFEVAVAKAWINDAYEQACWDAHQVFAGVGYTVDAGLMPLYSRRGKGQYIYLGDTAHHLKKVAEEIEKWPVPEKPKGRPLGLWSQPEEEQVPAWQPWRERWEKIQARKRERAGKKAKAI